MTTLFEKQNSKNSIKYGTKLTAKKLEDWFGVKGVYSFTTSKFDNSSFLFYGNNVVGNTSTEVSEEGNVSISTRLRSDKPYDDGLLPEGTEIGNIVFLIKREGNHFVFSGVAELTEIKIIRREKEKNGKWVLTCIYYGTLREEESAYSLIPVENMELETTVYVPTSEGSKKAIYTTKYERKKVNRDAAIAIHGTKCMACGFDFERMYGKYGKGFIEVHHTKPLFENDEEITPDPNTDLICLCSNCHRMVHHFKNKVLSLEELKEIITDANIKNDLDVN